jgi:Ser/Thr protein kinase RdoA (MazF antagonist)
MSEPSAGCDRPPRCVRTAADLELLPGDVRPREGRAWLVGWRGSTGVLRSVPVPAGSMPRKTEDVRWLHGFLARLAVTGFPAPRPLPCFGGMSWTARGGVLWEVVSYLPGHAVRWDVAPPMEDVGTLLGRYHAAARQVSAGRQRPDALPLGKVPAVLLSHRMERVPPGEAAVIRQFAAQLARDLDEAGQLIADRVVIHGDFTNDNVIADGRPPAVSGVIDFALAHVESPLADLGYGLWRSGRPYEQADHLDLSKVRRFVRGYASTARISPAQAALIPLYLRGRGLQMIAKRVRAGRNDTGMLAQVRWLTTHQSAIAETILAALE